MDSSLHNKYGEDNKMTGLNAMKEAVLYWWNDVTYEYGMGEDKIKRCAPEFINKLCHVIYRLKHEVFNFEKGTWEYEGR